MLLGRYNHGGIMTKIQIVPYDKAAGAFYGLIACDALGGPLEFSEPNSFTPIQGPIEGGLFDLEYGEWTDDTSMALCLAQSLIDKNGFDAKDQLMKYVAWYSHGYMSTREHCFDIGSTTQRALERFMTNKEHIKAPADLSGSNGSIMRLAPIVIAYANDSLDAVIHYSGESSKTTHNSEIQIAACQFLGALIYGGLQGYEKELILKPNYVRNRISNPHLLDGIVKDQLYKQGWTPRSHGDAYRTLECALWAFYHSESFEEGALKAVNLGGDTDTIGAVYGQIAGAYYGAKEIPKLWLDILAHKPVLDDIFKKLHSFSIKPIMSSTSGPE